jgi:hypothetical protein
MPADDGNHMVQEAWQPLKPVILRDSRVYHLAQDRLLIHCDSKDLLVDCARGVYLPQHSGLTENLKPLKIDGEVLLDLAKDCKWHCHRKWELCEQIGQIGLFIEVSAMEYRIERVDDEAYDRDDVSDWFAFGGGHMMPVNYSVQVIIQALLHGEPRIRSLGASALGFLICHRDHGCYTLEEDRLLDLAQKVLREGKNRQNEKLIAEVLGQNPDRSQK